jgi:hypothetical protein
MFEPDQPALVEQVAAAVRLFLNGSVDVVPPA